MGLIIQNESRIESDNNDQFRIIQFLGSGGNCQVYLAVATSGIWKGVLFAIKFFMQKNDPDRLIQFNKETDFLMETSHPSIMKVYAKGEHYDTKSREKIPFVVADYFQDRLDHKLNNNKLGVSEKIMYLMQLLSALQFLESSSPQIVHRDIKPQNIFLRGYTCVLGDFGLMRDLIPEAYDEDGKFLKQSPGPGMPFSYRTPDLVNYANKIESLTTASDIFQLGLVAAEMFTRKNPLKKCKDKLDPIELYDLGFIPGINGEQIQSIIEGMLVINPTDRSKLENLLDDFDGILRYVTTKQIEIDGFAF